MKKILMIAAAVLCAASVTASAESISMKYNTDFAELSCIGSFGSGYVKLIIVPYGTNPETLDESTVNSSKNIIMKTDEIRSGSELTDTIAFDKSFPNGRYMLYAINENAVLKKAFIKCDAAELSEFVKKLNACDKNGRINLIKSECPLSSAKDDSDYISKRIAQIGESGIYTADSFYKSYLISCGAAEFESGKMTFADMLMQYDSGNEIYEDYISREDNVKMGIADYIKSAGLGKNELYAAYGDALYTSQCRYAPSYADLKKTVTEYFKKKGKNLTEYNSITEYRQTRVFEKMYAARYGFTSPETIEKAFDTALAEVKSEGSKSSPGGGSGGGTGGNKGVSSGGSFGSVEAKTDSKARLSDIDGHWCADIITEMYENGNISGYEDNTFRPDLKITRAEFVKLTAAAMSLPIVSGHKFDDVSSSAWYSGYVCTAYENGLVTGTDDNMFMPDKNITREDAAVIIYRAAKKLGIDAAGTAEFDDSGDAADYAAEAIGALSQKGIINGNGGKFFPKNDITRAEAAAMLYRLINSR